MAEVVISGRARGWCIGGGGRGEAEGRGGEEEVRVASVRGKVASLLLALVSSNLVRDNSLGVLYEWLRGSVK